MTDFSSNEIPQFNEDFRKSHYHQNLLNFKLEDLLDREAINLDNKNISEFIKNKRILITGAAGSIGRNLVKQIILFKPKRLILLDKSETAVYELDEEIREMRISGIEIVSFIGDVSDDKRMKPLFQKNQPQIIFHAAANKHVPLLERNAYEAIKTNIFGTKILADLAVEFWVEKFILISTDKAVNPSNVMGVTKRFAEIILQNLNKTNNTTQFIVTRFGNVLGTKGSVVPVFKRQIERGGPVEITDAKVKRYFITMSEACQLVLEAGATGHANEIFTLDMGELVLLKALAEKMIRLTGLQPDVDIEIIYIGLRAGEKLVEERLGIDEEDTPAHHPKLRIARLAALDGFEVDKVLTKLGKALDAGEDNEMILILKEAIPEYISHNSEFEKLDIFRAAKVEKNITE
ncbi:polysaccharide biosynthesis protein [Dyadobacter sp. CY356]|uniref:polysaccharide biosynthesis protein n=1 Tax=Dyadobacter sp. CY356 TaxID=2906442 RepID=UPI001F42A742|nr:polysaccharide biosynthesis protein [Dyadobacter sp. CY356]MCF0059388.1 polysaccharide biosynthesis protein [Dyadobacter sp. CY356]